MKAGLALLALFVAAGIVPTWRHNPRERTTEGVESWQEGRFGAAREALDQALELRPDDPTVRFNAGTGRLGAGAVEEALEPLTAATDDPLLAPRAHYNLGNAYLQQGQPAAAVEAYRQTLRQDPGHADAKHNLEIALRQLQEREQQQQEQEQQQQEQEQEQEQQSEAERQGQPSRQKESRDEGDPPPSPEPPPSSPEPDEARGGEEETSSPQPRPEDRPSRLPQFRDQEDMTAEQAAALLEAVENLEREQRRDMAAEERRQRLGRTTVEKDW